MSLVLLRRVGEVIVIGDNIEVRVIGISGNQVRIGVDAPKHIPVHREEIQQRINAEKSLGIVDHRRAEKVQDELDTRGSLIAEYNRAQGRV